MKFFKRIECVHGKDIVEIAKKELGLVSRIFIPFAKELPKKDTDYKILAKECLKTNYARSSYALKRHESVV